MSVPQLAISDEFMVALAKLPKSQRKKVREFTKKFRADPKSAAINYEKIHNMDDDRVRTVRIDQKYRAVVLHPNQGNTYVLVWVDNHDEAMDWAKNRTFEVHPETQSLQILNVERVQQALSNADANSLASDPLFNQDDQTLLSFGIPRILLPAIRKLESKDQLPELKGVLPEEAIESLFFLAEGESVEDVREVVGMVGTKKTSPAAPLADGPEESEDQTVIGTQASRRFVNVTSDEELDRILSAPLERWRVFLHPHQRRMSLQSFGGPTLVLGSAGTGKTIVAMHRARQLALKLAGNGKVLFTTFTKNLAENVRSVLETMCGDEFERIDVQHIHEHAMAWLNQAGAVKIASENDLALAWDQVAVDNPTTFETDILYEEWLYARAIKGVLDRANYLKMSRVGRTPPMSRRERASAWNAFELYDEALRASGKISWVSVSAEARLKASEAAAPLYQHVIVDEGQDFTAIDWQFVRSLVQPGKDDIFIVADPRQRIYHEPTLLSDAGVFVDDRIYRLQVNYRTTEQIREWATCQSGANMSADLCESSWADTSTLSLMAGPEPTLLRHDDQQSEAASIAELIGTLEDNYPVEEIAIVVRAAWLLKTLKAALKSRNIEWTVVDGDEQNPSGVQLATMHRVKGLEYRCVIIAGLADNVFPTKFRGREEDEVGKMRHLTAEKNLLYVAASRARDLLFVSTVGDFEKIEFLEASANTTS